MGLYDNYNKVTNLRQYMDKKKYEDHKYKSKLRLMNNIKKRFETSFIGSLDSIENSLGHLWGRDLDKKDRTPQQVRMLKEWLRLRSIILDKGNIQLRNAIRDIEDYEINYIGKKIVFINGDDE